MIDKTIFIKQSTAKSHEKMTLDSARYKPSKDQPSGGGFNSIFVVVLSRSGRGCRSMNSRHFAPSSDRIFAMAAVWFTSISIGRTCWQNALYVVSVSKSSSVNSISTFFRPWNSQISNELFIPPAEDDDVAAPSAAASFFAFRLFEPLFSASSGPSSPTNCGSSTASESGWTAGSIVAEVDAAAVVAEDFDFFFFELPPFFREPPFLREPPFFEDFFAGVSTATSSVPLPTAAVAGSVGGWPYAWKFILLARALKLYPPSSSSSASYENKRNSHRTQHSKLPYNEYSRYNQSINRPATRKKNKVTVKAINQSIDRTNRPSAYQQCHPKINQNLFLRQIESKTFFPHIMLTHGKIIKYCEISPQHLSKNRLIVQFHLQQKSQSINQSIDRLISPPFSVSSIDTIDQTWLPRQIEPKFLSNGVLIWDNRTKESSLQPFYTKNDFIVQFKDQPKQAIDSIKSINQRVVQHTSNRRNQSKHDRVGNRAQNFFQVAH